MSKGFLVLAQNNGETDYVRQAYALALSIKKTQRTVTGVTLVTNDTVPEEYKHAFEHIVPIPFGDQASSSSWKVENRWKLYHATPYERTIVLDADMLVLSSLDRAWRFAEGHDLLFTSEVKDYKGRIADSKMYRKMFVENDLPNLYTGMHYFKKSEKAKDFFKLVEYISYNWERFYFELAPNHMQKFFSMDVTVALAAKIFGEDFTYPKSPFTFAHMKPGLQGWDPVPMSCYSQVTPYLNDDIQLTVGNFKQFGVFHYVEDEFLTEDMIRKLNAES